MITIDDFIRFYFRLANKNLNFLGTHSENTTIISCDVAAQMDFKGQELELLRTGSLLHDIGKLFVPAEILNASRKLTDSEFELIKTHTVAGFNCFDFKVMPEIKTFCLLHHYRDGHGYPDFNLQKINIDKILIDILTIADSFSALVEPRIYKKSTSFLNALEILDNKDCKKNKGINLEILDVLKYLINSEKITLKDYF
jgi:energy-coupling factor transport system substrate-specific component